MCVEEGALYFARQEIIEHLTSRCTQTYILTKARKLIKSKSKPAKREVVLIISLQDLSLGQQILNIHKVDNTMYC